LPGAYECLASLRKVLQTTREDLKEKMARGVSDPQYHELVGRCKELTSSIDKINLQIKSLNGDDDESAAPL